MKKNFDPFPNLITTRLVLRQLDVRDMDEFFILKSDKRLLKYYAPIGKTYDESYRKLQELNADIKDGESITWGITMKNYNKLIGTVCFWNFSEEEYKAEIGYELMIEMQGKGIMKEALEAVIEYGFNYMQLNVIEAVPDPNNESSVRLLERNNFIKGESFIETYGFNGEIVRRVTYRLMNIKGNI
ncbi:GNAT family N-acetyltransferase [Clostridium intestinale]|uniref:N-acetyltransferase GCN5 n=1 Tax=Clostridium intestinale URNW TaxID=1294142 RepID=U2PVE6_9CLOT|nr:GNAT family N-acetyltransferase [Clostridium intestinale]ERK30420.1 N-acetyltransferase GCN5 [Clostridium intestinale URNW]